MKKQTLMIIAVLVLVGIAVLVYMQQPKNMPANSATNVSAEVPEGATVITLTKDGFVPSKITIPAGTTVAFVTENGKIYWPASNLHPSHALYPEFDPLMPVQPDEAWSFTFTKAGEWLYHDHLAPYYTGTITVTP